MPMKSACSMAITPASANSCKPKTTAHSHTSHTLAITSPTLAITRALALALTIPHYTDTDVETRNAISCGLWSHTRTHTRTHTCSG
jgi:hypothetical protein